MLNIKTIRGDFFVAYLELINSNDICILGDYHFVYNGCRYIHRPTFDKVYKNDVDDYNYLRETNIVKTSQDIIQLQDQINSVEIFSKILNYNELFIQIEYFQDDDVIPLIDCFSDKKLCKKFLSNFVKVLSNHENFEVYMKYINVNDVLYIKSLDKFVFTDYEEIYYITNKNEFDIFNYIIDIDIRKNMKENDPTHIYLKIKKSDNIMINDFVRFYKIIDMDQLSTQYDIYSKYFHN